jgi:Uncharacterized protein SCO1/SenC/PrrC, involved in biogenesis of respiratory and photosynthetic systems
MVRSKNQPSVAPLKEQRFQVRGQIRSFGQDGRTVQVAHEEIPGYMEAMVMALGVRPPSLLAGLKIGDEIAFQLTVTEDDSWISQLQRISESGAATASTAVVKEAQRLQPGEIVPDFALVNQRGENVKLSDFRGKAVLLTFIYTRCPLPNFCPLMSKNFAALQERLQKEFPGQFQLISVTIDPKFDRPEILADYAKRWSKDDRTWTFATSTVEQMESLGAAFGLTVEPMGGLINHDLRTALIASDARLVHVWKSNLWTPYEVQRLVRETLTGQRDLASR